MNLNASAADPGQLSAYPTEDGSFSLESERFGEAFHNSAGALNEAQAKFAKPAELSRFVAGQRLGVLDVCVGLGYNTAVILAGLAEPPPALHWWGLELDRRPLQLALADAGFRSQWPESVLRRLKAIHTSDGWTDDCFNDNGLTDALSCGTQLWGDARMMLQRIPEAQSFDLILQDAFSPQRCPELWTEEFLSDLAGRLAPGGRLLTYSRSAAVRASLQRAGLKLYSLLPAPGERIGWSSGTMAVKPGGNCMETGPGWRPLRAMEREHLLTRAAVPFRDPDGRASSAEILTHRKLEQEQCNLEATNVWQRRWNIAQGKPRL